MRSTIRRLATGSLIVLVNLALLIAVLVFIEGLLSYAIFFRTFSRHGLQPLRHHTQYDSELGWVSLPNLDIKNIYGPGAHLRTNGRGFRNSDDFPPSRHPDRRRILCSGDSVTFGQYVDDHQAFCNLFASLDPTLEAINMGQVGYGVDQAYLWYRRDADDLDVDIHILAFITHDFLRMQFDEFIGFPRPVMVVRDGKLELSNTPLSQAPFSLPWLTLLSRGADRLKTVEVAAKLRKKLPLAPREVSGALTIRGVDEVQEVLGALFEELRDYNDDHSRTTVLLYLPSVEELQNPTQDLADWGSFVESNAAELDVLFVDLVKNFASLPIHQATGLFVDGYHLSEEGNARVARAVLERLRVDPRTARRLIDN